MVYINIKDTDPVVYIPANGWGGDHKDLDLTLVNTVDRNEVAIPITTARGAGFLIRLDVDIPAELYAGEWQYTLVADLEETVATGLLVVYDGEKAPAVQYNSENKVIQYGG